MKFDARSLIGPLVAALVLVLVVRQTTGALHRAGLWGGTRRASFERPQDPYARLDQAIAIAVAPAPAAPLRDPFAYGAGPAVAGVRLAHPKATAPPPIELPVVTAIVWDADPRALIRLKGHEYTVRSGGLFDDYRVVSITRDQVTLDQHGKSLVINRPLKGE